MGGIMCDDAKEWDTIKVVTCPNSGLPDPCDGVKCPEGKHCEGGTCVPNETPTCAGKDEKPSSDKPCCDGLTLDTSRGECEIPPPEDSISLTIKYADYTDIEIAKMTISPPPSN